MKAIIEKYGIQNIWHFTDRSNWNSIQQHGGLLSLKKLNDRGIDIPMPGGNDWSHEADENRGLDKYVHLTFVSNHPMLYVAQQELRITNPIWLKIDVTVLMDLRVRFCSSVANGNGAKLLSHQEAVDEIDFEVLFTRMDWHNSEIHNRRNAAEKSEILVPDMVRLDKILGCYNG